MGVEGVRWAEGGALVLAWLGKGVWRQFGRAGAGHVGGWWSDRANKPEIWTGANVKYVCTPSCMINMGVYLLITWMQQRTQLEVRHFQCVQFIGMSE